MSTNPNQVAINMTELAITTSIVETDGRHNNQHTEESDGHISHPSRNENRRNGHDIRSFDDGSKTDANDEGDSDQSHRNHLSRSTSRERHHSRSSAVSGRTRRDVASATPERLARSRRDLQSVFNDPLLATDLQPNLPIVKNRVIPDINVYQQKKNLAQGMINLALFSANANQLRYVIDSHARHPYFGFSFITLTLSLILQVAVAVGFILNSRYNVKKSDQIFRANKVNNATVIGIFLITILNVFITVFGVADSTPMPRKT